MSIVINRRFLNNFFFDFRNKIKSAATPREGAAYSYSANRYVLAYKRRLATHRNYFRTIESDYEPRWRCLAARVETTSPSETPHDTHLTRNEINPIEIANPVRKVCGISLCFAITTFYSIWPLVLLSYLHRIKINIYSKINCNN